MKKIKLAFLLMLFSLYLPGRAYPSCLEYDSLAESFTDNVARQQYLASYQLDACGGGGGGGGGVSVPTCTSGQYLSGSSCLYCSSAMPGCSACSSASVCTTCFSGYYKSGSKCAECPAGCSACSSSTTCTACDSGYTLSSGKCIKPCDSNCSSCDTSTGKCNTCKTAYFKNTLGKCTACPTGCSSCSNASGCSKCASGYTMIGNQCYSGQTKCPDGQTLTDGTCCNF